MFSNLTTSCVPPPPVTRFPHFTHVFGIGLSQNENTPLPLARDVICEWPNLLPYLPYNLC